MAVTEPSSARLLLPPLRNRRAATLQQHLADRRDALRDEADRRGYQQQGRRRRHRTPPGRRSTRPAGLRRRHPAVWSHKTI
jgi:hypothetical protein